MRSTSATSAWARCYAAAQSVSTSALRWNHVRWMSTASSITGPTSVADAMAQQLSSPRVMAQLRQYGFCVIDRVLSGDHASRSDQLPSPPTSAAAASPSRSPPCSSPLSARLRAEILSLAAAGLMRPNHTHLVQRGAARAFLPKQRILETDFAARAELLVARPPTPVNGSNANGAAEASLPESSRQFWSEWVQSRATIDALNEQLGPQCVIDTQTIKAQVNEGHSGCFPLHFDTDARVDARKLTAILYLNPSWAPGPAALTPDGDGISADSASSDASSGGDGGSLRLYPLPHAPIDIAPVDERMVLFDSSRMLHRVLPAARQRVCVSVWFWQQEEQWKQQQQGQAAAEASSFAQQQDATLRALLGPHASSSQLTAWSHLLSPRYFPHFSKLAYSHEWFSSLEQSHAHSEQRQAMLVKHLDECDMIERALAPLLRQIGPAQTSDEADGAARWAPDADYSQAWRSGLPLPWPVPPTLPPFCNVVGESETGAETGDGSSDTPVEKSQAGAAVPRLVEWLA